MNKVEVLEQMRKLKTRKETRDFYMSLPRELQEDLSIIYVLRQVRSDLFWRKFWAKYYRWRFSR